MTTFFIILIVALFTALFTFVLIKSQNENEKFKGKYLLIEEGDSKEVVDSMLGEPDDYHSIGGPFDKAVYCQRHFLTKRQTGKQITVIYKNNCVCKKEEVNIL